MLLSAIIGTLCVGFGSANTVTNYQMYPLTMGAEQYIQNASLDKSQFPQGMNTAYGSGLAFDGYEKDGSIRLVSVTDRGPNLDGLNVKDNNKTYPSKIFPAPDFKPQIATIVLKDNKAVVVSSKPILNPNGTAVTGLPIPSGQVGSSNEKALTTDITVIGYDENGLDPEGIAPDADGNFWLSDEYGPFIIKVDKSGKIIEKFSPANGLPEIASQRTPNCGAEGVTVLPNGHVVFFIQSILNLNNETKKTATICRVFDWNPKTQQYTTYAYPIEATYKKNNDAKLGDIVALDNHRMLLIEQGKQADGSMMNKVFEIDLRIGQDITNLLINGKPPEYATAAEVTPYALKKTEVLDLRAYGWNTEKAEGLTVTPDHKTLVIANDNDFGIATKVTDPERQKADVADYTLDTSTGKIFYKEKDAAPKEANSTISIKPGGETSQVWTFTFKDKL